MNLGIHFDRAIAAYRHKEAIIDGAERISYDQLGENATRLANAMVADGFRTGDRAAILMPNCHQAIAVDGAVMKSGIVKVPLNARVSAGEIQAMLKDSGASILFTHAGLVDLAQASLDGIDGVRQIVVVGDVDPRLGWTDFDNFKAAGSADPVRAELDKDSLYSLNYTSGTSGVLKAAMLTHGNWICLTRSYLMAQGQDSSGSGLAAYVAPITHAAGGQILANMLSGRSNLLLTKFEPSDFLRVVEEYKVTDVLLVPTMINMLLECPDIKSRDISSLRRIVYGTAPMAPERIKQALAVFGPVLSQGYGQTESTGIISTLGLEDHLVVNDPALAHRLTSAGRPSFEVDLRIVDEDGGDVPTGEIGEIIVRGDMVMRGYWNAPELTAETIRDGWLYTRDMGRMDEDGYLYLVDRKSDMIISGGFNVYPAEVENALMEHPAVFEVAVVGVPDVKWGEAVKAVVVTKADTNEEELVAHCSERLARFKAPRSVDFVDALPKSAVGKTLRRVIREQYWEGMSRRIS